MTVRPGRRRAVGRRQRPVRRVTLYGYLGSGNFGNDASMETVLTWLRRDHPDVRISCITIAPETMTGRYGVPATRLSWYTPRPGEGRVAALARKLAGRAFDVPRGFALVGSTDAVIIPGMGVLEETLGVVPWGLPLWLYVMALSCRLRGRRFVLLDVGAEPARNPVTRRLFVATANLAAHVSYRDEWSAESMRRAGARRPDAVVPDIAFAHSAPTDAIPQPGVVVVGVMAFYGPGDDPVAGASVRLNYVHVMADAIARLTDAGDRVVLLGGDLVDADVAHQLAAAVRAARPELAPEALVVRDVTTFAEVSDVMAGAEVVVASRFHNLIAALRLARPVVSLGYAEKSARLMQELGLGDYCQDLNRLDGARLLAQVHAARNDGDLPDRLRHATAGFRADVERLLGQVGEETLGLTARRNLQETAPRPAGRQA